MSQHYQGGACISSKQWILSQNKVGINDLELLEGLVPRQAKGVICNFEGIHCKLVSRQLG